MMEALESFSADWSEPLIIGSTCTVSLTKHAVFRMLLRIMKGHTSAKQFFLTKNNILQTFMHCKELHALETWMIADVECRIKVTQFDVYAEKNICWTTAQWVNSSLVILEGMILSNTGAEI